MPDLLLKPAPHYEAADWIRNKPIVARETFDRLVPELRARAFVVTGVENANVVQTLRDRIAELPEGASWDAVKADVVKGLSPWLDDAESGTKRAERRATVLLRQHGFQAYAASQYEVMNRQRAVFPFWQYQTAQDDRVRDSHAALDGLVMPADSPFWKTHFPPWDWNCRCTVVPLQQADVDAMQQADARKVPEARRVLPPDQQKKLERDGIVVREIPGAGDRAGVPRPINVTPRPDAPTFEPGTLRMDAAQLRPRYAPDAWKAFEDQARRERLYPASSSPVTVLDWVNGRNAISASLRVRTTGSHRGDIERGVSAIDQVHAITAAPAVPIFGATRSSALGTYSWDGPTLRPSQIGVRSPEQGGTWPGMTTVHELGHYLDHQALGKPGEFASVRSPVLEPFRRAVMATEAVRRIEALPRRMQGEFLKPYELWARAYAQYITTRSRDPALRGQLDKIRTGGQAWRQWSDDDFAPVAAAIDAVLKAKGWAFSP